MKYIGDIDKGQLDIDSAIYLANKGIDVFNPRDDFFNNICKQNADINNKDMILIDRRTDIFQNATFCQNGCSYKGMNYDLMAANCLCDSYSLEFEENKNNENNNKIKNDKISFNSIKKHLLSNLLDFNIDVMKCYNLVFNLNILSSNIGFYSMFIMFILQLIFLFVFCIKRLKPLKQFILRFIKSKSNSIIIPLSNKSIKSSTHNILHYNNEKTLNYDKNKIIKKKKKKRIKKKNFCPKTKIRIKDKIISYKEKNDLSSERKININENENEENEYNKENILINKNLPSAIKTGKNKISNSKHGLFYIKKFNRKINIKNKINNLYVKGKNNKINEREIDSDKIIKYNKISIKKNKEKKFNKKIINKKHLILKQNQKISKKIKHINNLYLIDDDLQDMNYEEAIRSDKRSFLRMFWTFLIDKLIILGTFFTNNYFDLFIIKLSFLVYTFQISFFLNALFYTDEYISKSYHNNGVLDFISGLPKSLYSSITTLITTNLLQMLSNSKSELMQLVKNLKINIDYVIIIENKLRKLRNKLIAYYIIVFSLGLFFLYYATSFCATYRHSQKYWFFGCIESFVFDSLISFMICLLIALLRYVSIRKKIKYLYMIINITNKFL